MTQRPGATGMTAAYDWHGRTVVDVDGERIGTFDALYLDDDTGAPEWATVNTGLFGTKSSFVPLSRAEPAGEDVRVHVKKETVKQAPKVDADAQLSHAEEAELYRHYGLDHAEQEPGSGPPPRSGGAPADDAMTRSEEEVHVGKAQRETGRVRLRKYVVTEEVERRIPVRREKARIEREPITDENREQALRGPDITESEHEIVLHEEEPVVEKRTVPKERVHLEKDVETVEESVAEDVRKERVEVEGDR